MIYPPGIKPPGWALLDYTDPLTEGLVGFWPLGEGGGNIARDLAMGRTGTLTASTWKATAHGRQFGVAPNFGGAGYLDVGSRFDFSATKEFSLVAWVLLTASDQTDGACVFCRGDGGGGEQYVIDLRSAVNDGPIRFYTRDAGGSVNGNIRSSSLVAQNNTAWRLVVGTFSGRNATQNLYIDGQLADTTAVSSSLQANSHVTSIGGRQSGSGSYDLATVGWLAAPRIYDRALTAGEVSRLFREPFAGVVRTKRPFSAAAAVVATSRFNPMSGRGGSAAQPLAVH